MVWATTKRWTRPLQPCLRRTKVTSIFFTVQFSTSSCFLARGKLYVTHHKTQLWSTVWLNRGLVCWIRYIGIQEDSKLSVGASEIAFKKSSVVSVSIHLNWRNIFCFFDLRCRLVAYMKMEDQLSHQCTHPPIARESVRFWSHRLICWSILNNAVKTVE